MVRALVDGRVFVAVAHVLVLTVATVQSQPAHMYYTILCVGVQEGCMHAKASGSCVLR